MKVLAHGSRFILAFTATFSVFIATAQTTNGLSDAEIKGRELAQKILNLKPTVNAEQTGVLKIRNEDGKTTAVAIDCGIFVTPTNWGSIYKTIGTNGDVTEDNLTIWHSESNGYDRFVTLTNGWHSGRILKITEPFANSDFWLCDLGLEFFHWPEQKILKHEFRRTRGCNVLESINPNPTNGYSRVDCWIDEETLGIVHAEAYDSKNKLLKEFDPKEFKKVNGQWQLQEMEIRNVQTGSRTRMEFDLPKNKS